MYVFDGKCPHCGSDRGFAAFGVSGCEMFDFGESSFSPAILDKWRRKYADNELGWYSLGGVCLKCKKPVVAYILAGLNERKLIYQSLKNDEIEYSEKRIHTEKIEIYPKPEQEYSHESIPAGINKRFKSVQIMLKTDGIYPSDILTACRDTLESAVNDIGAMDGKENLKKKIKTLLEDGIITTQIHRWAETIADFGNDGAHYGEGTREDADEMVEFTKIFLQYAYEFPARIRQKRKEIDKRREERRKKG